MTNKAQKLWFEYLREDQEIDFSSFETQDQLHPDFWDREKILNLEASERLVKIVEDFISNLDLNHSVIEDILLTGSLAAYNWSEYSDVDLHILVDFKQIDENFLLVKEYFNGKAFVWNTKHDIHLFGHEVEIYVQDINEDHVAAGIYSVLNDRWMAEPLKIDPKIDYNNVEKKASYLIDSIDRLFVLFDQEKYSEVQELGSKLKKKIKNMRKTGLEAAGIYSPENLAFKVLRRNGYMGHLNDVLTKSYDKMQSLPKNHAKKFNLYVFSQKNNENNGFNALNELEAYQKKVKSRHNRHKRLNIGLGGQKNTPPYNNKPNYNRAESSPPLGE